MEIHYDKDREEWLKKQLALAEEMLIEFANTEKTRFTYELFSRVSKKDKALPQARYRDGIDGRVYLLLGPLNKAK